MLAKQNRLTANKDITKNLHKGQKLFLPFCIVIYTQNPTQTTLKIAFIASKKVGNAVARNRAKRLLRSAFRNLLPQLKSNLTICCIASKRVLGYNSEDIAGILLASLRSKELIHP